jgi:hypothetical protein
LLRLKEIVKNPYEVGDVVEFYNSYGKWISGIITDFKINDYVYKAIIKCYESKCCRLHYICIYSTYLRKYDGLDSSLAR